MNLTEELYDQVIRAIRTGQRRTGDARRLGRAGVGLGVTVLRGVAPQRRMVVRVRDLSPTGIGFIAAERIPARERVLVELPRANGEPLLIVAEVRHCERATDRLFRIGAIFLEDSAGTDYSPARRAVSVRNAVPS